MARTRLVLTLVGAALLAGATALKVGDSIEMIGLFRPRLALLLIYPWITAAADGPQRLVDALTQLPQWAVPLAICDTADKRDAAETSRHVHAVDGLPQTAGALEFGAVSIADVFIETMPRLITKACRTYLELAINPDDRRGSRSTLAIGVSHRTRRTEPTDG